MDGRDINNLVLINHSWPLAMQAGRYNRLLKSGFCGVVQK
jgi:hypothetical protein